MAFSKISSLALFCLVGLALALPSHAQDSPQDFVNAHNAARRQVGVGPVTWDESIAQFAKSYASQHTADCTKLVHSGNQQYGENLAGSSVDLSGTDAVNLWVRENVYYDHNSNTCVQKECRHYTQVVWSNSVRIGCGKARCSNGGTFIGCNYAPRGNVRGQKPY